MPRRECTLEKMSDRWWTGLPQPVRAHVTDGAHLTARPSAFQHCRRSFFRIPGGAGPGITRLNQLCKTEVKNLGKAVFGDHDVLGLEVAMDYACGVRLGETVRHLRQVLKQFLEIHVLAVNLLVKRSAAHVLHCNVVDQTCLDIRLAFPPVGPSTSPIS